MAAKGATVDINTSPELVPWLDEVCADNPDLAPNGYGIETPQSTWQNGWSFMASGVPSFEISAGGPAYGDMYHSDYEAYDKVDWGLTEKMTMLFMRLNKFTDARKQLPYDFAGRAADLRDHFDPDELEAAGLIGGPVDSLDAAITRFSKVSRKFGASAAAITGDRGPASRNATMLKVAKRVVKGMTALDAWDYTAYPHEQTMWDNEYMLAAWHALDADPADTAAALEALTNVGLNWSGVVFSPSVYRYDLTRHDPDYEHITWGKLGKLINYFDMTPVMAEIQDGQIDQAMDDIYSMYSTNLYDLTKRVQNMTKTLNDASDMMEQAM